ncbi:MAG: helix-turn-helix domain-containing protein [Clostridiales bacterium]|jgi:transcriptional regulator with XRE-family HTH domain|nr:helix-turn-helix domain-containing protein [Clostridiales bacterium]
MYINIEAERIRRYMTKTELARKLAIDSAILDNWIHGRCAIPADRLRALSRLFDNCSVDYLLQERPKRKEVIRLGHAL